MVGIGEISAWLTDKSREFIPETRGSILAVSTVYTVLEGTCYRYSYIVLRREDDVYCIVADRDEERVLRGG